MANYIIPDFILCMLLRIWGKKPKLFCILNHLYLLMMLIEPILKTKVYPQAMGQWTHGVGQVI